MIERDLVIKIIELMDSEEGTSVSDLVELVKEYGDDRYEQGQNDWAAFIG